MLAFASLLLVVAPRASEPDLARAIEEGDARNAQLTIELLLVPRHSESAWLGLG